MKFQNGSQFIVEASKTSLDCVLFYFLSCKDVPELHLLHVEADSTSGDNGWWEEACTNIWDHMSLFVCCHKSACVVSKTNDASDPTMSKCATSLAYAMGCCTSCPVFSLTSHPLGSVQSWKTHLCFEESHGRMACRCFFLCCLRWACAPPHQVTDKSSACKHRCLWFLLLQDSRWTKQFQIISNHLHDSFAIWEVSLAPKNAKNAVRQCSVALEGIYNFTHNRQCSTCNKDVLNAAFDSVLPITHQMHDWEPTHHYTRCTCTYSRHCIVAQTKQPCTNN